MEKKMSKSFFIQEEFLSNSECQFYLNKAHKNVGVGPKISWEKRIYKLQPNDFIINKVQSFFKDFNIFLKAVDASITTWNVGTWSNLHVHGKGNTAYDDMRHNTKYNSIIYLNNNFEGGEFYTDNITIKPKKGTLTLFDGSKIFHGIKEIKKEERYIIIIWWER
tara:strand:+ start:235 stop:726 length:492 start_codon:yes stop_codon:yes gene_type:complete